MTEPEWLACDDAVRMLDWVQHRLSDRQLALFAVACLQALGHSANEPEPGQGAAAAWGALRYALVSHNAGWGAVLAPRSLGTFAFARSPGDSVPQVRPAALLRDLTGPLFAGVSLNPSWLTWNEGVVPKLARTIDEEGSFEALPVVADALEEAGCDCAALLDHCRSTGPHIRGCWALDLLLART
jgi:hypothetical protein